MRRDRSGYAVGFAAALQFGIRAPAAKLLLDDIGPQLLAGLLYLGAFLVVAPIEGFGPSRHEARLRRADLPPLTGLIVVGGIVAPVLLVVGLERVSGVTGSLLLNLEGPLALIVGVAIVGEYLGVDPAAPHSHPHRHESLTHAHLPAVVGME